MGPPQPPPPPTSPQPAPQQVCAECFARCASDATSCPRCGAVLGLRPGRGTRAPAASEPHAGNLAAIDPLFDDRSALAVDGAGPDGEPAARRRRAGAWILGLAVVAGAIGLSVRSADDGSGHEVDSAAATTTSVDDGRESGTETSRTRRTSTTNSRRSDRTTTTREPHGPYLLSPTGAHLLVADRGDLVVIDLDTGAERLVAEDIAEEVYPGSVRVYDGWIVSSANETLAIPIDGGEPRRIAGGGCGGFPSAQPGHWWTYDCSGPTQALSEIRLDDGEVVATYTPPFPAPVSGDSDAGLVISAPGGVYVVDDAGDISRVSDGSGGVVLGSHVLVTSCDERLACEMLLVDLVTGDGRPVDVPLTPGFGYYGGQVASVAGSRAVSVTYDEQGPLVQVIDVVSGEVFDLPENSDIDRFGFDGVTVLSPDGRWLFWASGGTVSAWLIGDPDVIELDSDLRRGGRTFIGGY